MVREHILPVSPMFKGDVSVLYRVNNDSALLDTLRAYRARCEQWKPVLRDFAKEWGLEAVEFQIGPSHLGFIPRGCDASKYSDGVVSTRYDAYGTSLIRANTRMGRAWAKKCKEVGLRPPVYSLEPYFTTKAIRSVTVYYIDSVYYVFILYDSRVRGFKALLGATAITADEFGASNIAGITSHKIRRIQVIKL